VPEAVQRRRRVAAAFLGAAAVSVLVLPPSTSADETAFEFGSGKVRSSLFEAVPRTGGLTIPYSGGKTFASYQGRRSEATSTVFKPPSEPPAAPAGAAAPAAECGEKAPGGGKKESGAPPNASPFTFNLTVSSDEENSEKGKHEVFQQSPDGSPIAGAVAEQQVFATDEPRGTAQSTQGRMGIEGVFEIKGGRTEAVAGVVEGKTREAAGVVEMQEISLLDGLVVIQGARWEAAQRSGAGAGSTARFSMGKGTIGGTPFAPPGPGDYQDSFFRAVNDALKPTGLILIPPTPVNSESEARVSPFSLRLSDSPIGRAAVGPVVGEAQPVRDPLVDAALGFSCEIGLVITVADVVLSGASGSGGVSFDFGGITASTDGSVYENPFGNGFGDPGGAFGDLPPGPDSSAGFPFTDFPTADGSALPPVFTPLPVTTDFAAALPAFQAPALPPLPVAGATPDGVGEEAAAPEYTSEIQPALGSSVSREDGHKGGSALAVGMVGLLAVAALIAADALHIKRGSA
jgi:hypothetical protein